MRKIYIGGYNYTWVYGMRPMGSIFAFIKIKRMDGEIVQR